MDIAGGKNPRYCNGYKRDDDRIIGFTQTHLSGTGCPDLCDFLLLPFTGDAGDGVRTQAIPRALFAQCVLRRRETGDRIRPLGGPGDKSLQDYWVDRRVDRPFRDHLPVLCVGRRVIWSVGVGVSEEGRVAPGSDAVYLRYEGYLPGESPD